MERKFIMIGLAATTMLACDREAPTALANGDASRLLVESASTNTVGASAPAPVVARLQVSPTTTIDFLDLGAGDVAVAERSRYGAVPFLLALAAREHASPLEIYQALTPAGTNPPALLQLDHERSASYSTAWRDVPRTLSRLRTSVSGLETPGPGTYSCDPLFVDWIDDWLQSFIGITKYRAADYKHQLWGSLTFYPGAPVYYGTNTNSITYLGACNGSDNILTMEVHRRINGVWVSILSVAVDTYEKYTFYSGIPAGYRAVLRSPKKDVVEHYGFGAAWTLSRPKTTP